MIGSTNVGGSGKCFAFIVVSYPSGSTCTCTKGTKTLRAKDTSGACVFYIPEAGTWTVSCTNGSQTKSESVTISTNGQSTSVSLSYSLYLYNNGDECSSVTGGFGFSSNSSSSLTRGASSLSFSVSRRSTYTFLNDYLYTNNAIDITNYSTLYVTYSKSVNAGGATGCGFGMSTTKTNGNDIRHDALGSYFNASRIHNTASGNYSEADTYAIDISSLSGSFYFKLMTSVGMDAGQTIAVSSVWLA